MTPAANIGPEAVPPIARGLVVEIDAALAPQVLDVREPGVAGDESYSDNALAGRDA